VSSLAWERRPIEERVNLNPAFLALLIREAAAGYHEEVGRALPLPLAFIVVPIVLHRPTREALPSISTSLPVWLQEHQLFRETFVSRARFMAPAVREALVVGLLSSLIVLVDGELEVGQDPRRERRGTADSRRITNRARFVGRWLARAGDVATVYLLWGMKP
jgi:hypothetical protein